MVLVYPSTCQTLGRNALDSFPMLLLSEEREGKLWKRAMSASVGLFGKLRLVHEITVLELALDLLDLVEHDREHNRQEQESPCEKDDHRLHSLQNCLHLLCFAGGPEQCIYHGEIVILPIVLSTLYFRCPVISRKCRR